jgi:uncharacterized repeat protein (TIGR01451 family)
MQRIYDFFQRARERINAKIAILVVVGLIGTVAVWQGFSHMAATKQPTGPKKQVATGLGLLDPQVKPAGGEVPDDELPAAGGGVKPLGSMYGDGASPAAEVDPYAVDPYAGAASSGGGDSASTVSGDSGASLYGPKPSTGVPDNPYRATVGDGDSSAPPTAPPTSAPSTFAPPTSPYGQTADAAPPAAATADTSTGPASESVAPVVNPSDVYSQRLKSSAAANAVESPPTTAPSGTSTTDPAGLSASPYKPSDTYTYGATSDTSSAPPPAETPPSRFSTESSSLGSGFGSGRLTASQPPPTVGQANALPGERHLEGPQQPAITIEKYSPAEIQVGKPATFEMIVRNVGQVPAQDVVVTDQVPAKTQLADVKPAPQQGSDGSLVWQFGTMQPGDEKVITMQVMPQDEGEIGTTAHVSFAAQATSRSICTRPQLSISHTAPPKVLIGETLTLGITVANPGTGPATGVMIEEDVPEGLSHVAGGQLEYEVGTLRPLEEKRLELTMKADKPGLIENTIVVRGEGNLTASHKVQIEVIAPQLEVDVEGPKKKYLNREATYTVSVVNPGTASARDVELIATLPRGMKFLEADSQGQYDPTTHAVYWSLEELPPTEGGTVKLTALPVEAGQWPLLVEGKADLGLAVRGEKTIEIQQIAELLHTVKDADEVIEVGSETTYLIKVSNVGTKAATNVSVVAHLPPGIQATAGEGPTRVVGGDPSQVTFEPLAKLEPNQEVTFKVQAKGMEAGDHIVRVQVSSNEWPDPVTREESTRVYVDR